MPTIVRDDYIHVDLCAEIKAFVSEIKVCPIEMILRYLPDYIPEKEIKKALNVLAKAGHIYVDWVPRDLGKGTVYDRTFNKKYLTDMRKKQQEDVILAGWILCHYGLFSLQYFERTKYPTQIVYVTKQNRMGDVTVINPQNIDVMRSLLPITWANAFTSEPEGKQCTHIAIVPSNKKWSGFNDFLEQVHQLGFHLYAIVDPETKEVEISTFNDIVSAQKANMVSYIDKPVAKRIVELAKTIGNAADKYEQEFAHCDITSKKNVQILGSFWLDLLKNVKELYAILKRKN